MGLFSRSHKKQEKKQEKAARRAPAPRDAASQ